MTPKPCHALDRRALLGSAAAALALGKFSLATAASHGRFFAMHHLPLGLQLYTLGPAVRDDLDGTMKRIAAIGYRTIEPASDHGHTPQALRAAADRAGLACTSIHIQARGVAGNPGLDGDIAKLAADVHILGATHVVMPMFPIPTHAPPPAPGEDARAYIIKVASTLTEDDWKDTAAFLNEKGRALEKEGLQLAYHNHNFEFRPLGRTTGFDIVARETDPALVVLEMDAGWVAAAGLSPIALLRKYPGRFRLMHVKDIRAATRPNFVLAQDPTEVGRGTLDWRTILPDAYAAGVRDFFVEQEPPFDKDRFEAVADSFAYLAAIKA